MDARVTRTIQVIRYDTVKGRIRMNWLETQRLTGDQARSFSGGFRRLEQEGTRKPPGS